MLGHIYLICVGPYRESSLDEYATTEAEIVQVVRNHCINNMYAPPDTLFIKLDMQKQVVLVEDDGYQTGLYSIHVIERVQTP